MGVGRILERVVRTTSLDRGDVIMVTACSSRHSLHIAMVASRRRHDPEVQFHYIDRLPPRSARHTSSTTPCIIGFRRVPLETVGDFAFAVGGSAVDCLRFCFDIVYAIYQL